MSKIYRSENVPPLAINLMESTRAIGYSVETAIADIIDNSISAEATEVDIRFDFIGVPYLYIADNGHGMTYEVLKNAMRYGSRNPSETRPNIDLGRYGLGMKTASLSQCRSVTVFTKKDGVFSGCCWDLDEIAKTNEWTLLILDEEDANVVPTIKEYLDAHTSCTIVLWRNFDNLVGENSGEEVNAKIASVRSHLSLVFHRFITEDKFKIKMNKREVEAADPFLLNPAYGTSVSRRDGGGYSFDSVHAKVQSYILPPIKDMSEACKEALEGEEGLRKNQGFYIYRNRRLLVWGTWFRLRRQTEKSKLARIQVDISNEVDRLWSLDIKKSQARPPEVIRPVLLQIIDKLAEANHRQTTFRGIKQASQDGVEDIWIKRKTNSGYEYCVNRDHPLVARFVTDKKFEILLQYIEERLPVDALYVDMIDDKKIDNYEAIEEEEEILEKLKQSLEVLGGESRAEREAFFKTLIKAHPFVEYLDFLQSKQDEVLNV